MLFGDNSDVDPEILETLRRNSGLSLSIDGVFYFQGDVVPNPRVQDLFHRGLSVRDDGDVTLKVGEIWAYVKAAGVARFITALKPGAAGLVLRWRDLSEGGAEQPFIGIASDDRFYLWENQAAKPAILLRSAHQALAECLEEGEGGPGLALPQGRVIIAELHEVPGPSTDRP